MINWKYANYELWHDRQVDHIASNCNMWQQILQYVEEQAPRIKRQQIETLDCMGFNAWELAVTLDQIVGVLALRYVVPQEEESLRR